MNGIINTTVRLNRIIINSKTIVSLIVFITPFIDVINAICHVLGIAGSLSFGQVIRMAIIFSTISFMLIRNIKKVWLIISLIVLLFLKTIVYHSIYSTSIFSDISCDLRYIYVIVFGSIVFDSVEKGNITDQDVLGLIKLLVAIVAIVSVTANKIGFGIVYAGTKRVFTEVNALTAVLVIGVGVYLYDLLFERFNMLNMIISLIVIYASLSQATKTGLIGVLSCGVFLLLYTGFVRKQYIKQIAITVVGALTCIVIIYKFYIHGNGVDAIQRWKYFYSNMDLLSFMLSGRNQMLLNTVQVWKSSAINVLLGMGYSRTEQLLFYIDRDQNFNGAEMDYFDVVFYYGVLGFSFVVFLLRHYIKCLKCLTYKNKYSYFCFLYIISSTISFLGGHVLNSPLAGVVFCLVFSLSINHNKISGRSNEKDFISLWHKTRSN